MALLAKFFGRTASEGAAFALGVATGPVLYPAVREIEQEANRIYPTAAVSPGEAAQIVAEDVEQRAWGAEQALRHGLDGGKFDALIGEVLNAPGLPELLSMWRRDLIDTAAFVHGLRKAKLEGRWDGPLEGLRDVLLTPAELANARQQGYIDQARQYDEASKQGVTNGRAEIQFESVGLPPGHAEASFLLNRGLIDDAGFATMIREGHTKTKYTDVLRTAAQYVLHPNDYIQGRLRGWIDDAAMYAGTRLHGVSQGDTDLLFKIHGRPLSWHQVFIGRRRGGTYNGGTAGIDPAFLNALRQSDIRPEWYDLAWAQRFNYPTAFVLRALTEAHDITQARAEEILLFEGWEPALAAQVSAKWYGTGAAAKQDPWVAKADGQLWTATHKGYVKAGIPQAAAAVALTRLGLDAQVQAAVFALWDEERTINATAPAVP